jgi:chromosome segregation ATPase
MQDQKKKVSVYINFAYVRQMEDAGLSQTEAISRALEYYFSEDRQKTEEYKQRILEDEKKILVLEARLSEFETLKEELKRAHQTIDSMREEHQTHVLQVQTLINKMEDRKQIETNEPKKQWWKFW